MVQAIPEPPEAGVVNALRFGSDTFRFLEAIQARYSDAAQLSVPGRPPIVLLTNPQLMREMLDRPETFGRVPAQDSAALIAEQGLVQSDGELWRQQRSVMQPAFAGRQVAAYADTTGRRVEQLATDWGARGERGVNLHREMTSLTVRVASEILLGEDIGRERAAEFHEWMATAGREFEFGLDVATPDWLPDRISPEFETAAANIRGLAEELIEGRRAALAAGDHDGPPDMLTMLIRAEEDPEVNYPENQIRDEVATFLIAGHETTALSLSYTLSLLSQYPDERERVRAEARSVVGDGPLTHEDVESLPATKRAYREALRLYPPAWAVFRRANTDAQLGDYRLEEGAAVIAPLWSLHRDSRHFEAPEQFDPSRWERRNPGAVDAYMPFSVGPHACIGQAFALQGATLTLARLVSEFDVDVAPGELDDLRVTPTLRPQNGVRATVRPADR
ncbi:cytochrome P450 [Halosegnis sp.]|uniref:cytochrome P450 n=1 Tax=Halosegnis sp. TaxID=2864959 RepID=UPI0035D4A951